VTDRIFALTVLLDQDIRDDDVQPIVEAIKMVRHVQKVETHVSNIQVWAGEERARQKLGQQLWEVLYPRQTG